MHTETTAVRLVVDQHYGWRSATPESFDWELVINPKVAAIAQNLAQEIKDREQEWALTGRRGVDPVIPGLREALRLIARTAVWKVQSEQQRQVCEAARLGANHAANMHCQLPVGSKRELRTISLPAVW